jgi:hypothetical protein
MNLLRRQVIQKALHLKRNDYKPATCDFRNFYSASEHDANERIVPSLSENDNGSYAFSNSTWRQNKAWASQFSSPSTFLPSTSTARGLFGNVITEGSSERPRKLNNIIFNSGHSYMMHQLGNQMKL